MHGYQHSEDGRPTRYNIKINGICCQIFRTVSLDYLEVK